MDFCCFYFPLFCIHWLMGNHILPANPARYADDFRTDTMGILVPKWEGAWAKWMTRYLTVHFYGAMLYFVGLFRCITH